MNMILKFGHTPVSLCIRLIISFWWGDALRCKDILAYTAKCFGKGMKKDMPGINIVVLLLKRNETEKNENTNTGKGIYRYIEI